MVLYIAFLLGFVEHCRYFQCYHKLIYSSNHFRLFLLYIDEVILSGLSFWRSRNISNHDPLSVTIRHGSKHFLCRRRKMATPKRIYLFHYLKFHFYHVCIYQCSFRESKSARLIRAMRRYCFLRYRGQLLSKIAFALRQNRLFVVQSPIVSRLGTEITYLQA